jgi:hypothetical protein
MGARDGSGIARLRRRAALVLWAETLLRAIAPAGAIVAAYVALALFGCGNPWLFLAAAGLTLLALGAGAARLRRPAAHAIDRRIESASGLRHQPLGVLDDAPETETALAMEIWQAHRRRIAAVLEHARAGPPAPLAAVWDPLALRLLLALLLLSGAVIAGPAAPLRLAAAFAFPAWPLAGPGVNAWITPPAYTGQPPQILTPGEAVTALVGTKLTVVVDGPRQAPPVRLGGWIFPQTALGPASHRAEGVLTASGRLTIGPWWHRLAGWNVTVTPPQAPEVKLTGIEIAKGNLLKLKFHVADPYGLAALSAQFSPVGHPGALTLNFPLALNTGNGSAWLDLSTSPFHNLPVALVLRATNLAGAAGSDAPHGALVLPGLNLRDKTAIALDHQRQALAVAPPELLQVAVGLRGAAQAPPSGITAAADVQLAFLARAMLMRNASPQMAVDRLLALIEEIEGGPGYPAAQALAAANQALAAALERGLHGSQPDQAALQKLLQSMHEALARRLAGMPPAAGTQAGAQALDLSALDQLAQKIAADEAAGNTDQAARELRQLEQALEALQSATPMTAAQAAQAAAANQAAQQIGQMTKAEAALLDHTQAGNASPGEQARLQGQLQATGQALARAGIQLPGMGEAGQAMGAAKAALGQQDASQAERSETAAIQGLQQAASALAGMQRNGISIGQDGQPAPEPGAAGEDINGAPDEQTSPAFDFGSANAARAIQQRIIKDDSDPALAAPTHQYYRRLLDQESP